MSIGEFMKNVYEERAEARYDELAQRIYLYYELDATIEADVREFGELRKVLFTQDDFVLHGEG